MGFHEVHGENVRLEQGGKVARRAESFCKAIVFSSRPIQVNERVVLRIVELSNGWSGALRLGFTSHDPITLQGTLPKYACPDLTNRPGNWAKALGERYAAENTLLHYYVNNTGEVFFGINGEEKGLFLNGVDTRGPLWALIDIYGNTTAIKMVEDEQLLNNRNEMIRSVPLATGGVEELIRQMEGFNSARASAGAAPVISEMSSSESFDGTPLQSPPGRRPVTMHAPSGASSLQKLLFHKVLGPNSRLDPMDRQVAERCDLSEQRAFVFVSRTLCPNERLTVKVVGMDPALSGSLAFGLTTCDPASLAQTAAELPSDLDALLDRPEYWVFQKDIPCLLNDELTFVTGDDGRVHYSQNNGPFKTIMYVDGTQQFFPFFDIAGRVTKLKLIGSKRGAPLAVQEQSPDQPIAEKSTSKAPPPVEEPDTDCRICFEKPIESVLINCGHSLTCHDCGMKLLQGRDPQCPVCRQRIANVIRIFKA